MQTLTFLFAFIAVLALIGVAAWLVRRFANNRLGANTQRGRMPRLAVIDAAAVDGRRRLVLVRRDNVEHLLMIGGPSDIVVEPNIVRAMPGRDQMAPRPAVGEQPPRIAPLPDAAWSDEAARADARSTDAFDHAEPQMPEPPPRPARPSFADEVRRPAPPPMPSAAAIRWRALRRSRSAAAAPEPVPPRLPRTEPLMPRPQRASEPPKAPPREAPSREAPSVRRRPARAAGPRARTRRAPRAAAASARSASGSRAVERRPESRRDGAAAGSRPAPAGRDRSRRRLRRKRRLPARPAASPPVPARPAPQKSGFENLEDEMASLLGRPKNPS